MSYRNMPPRGFKRVAKATKRAENARNAKQLKRKATPPPARSSEPELNIKLPKLPWL